MGNPAGVKLNNHLSAAASSACIHVLDIWLMLHAWAGDYAAVAAASLLRWGGCLGLSFVIACALDVSNIACAWLLLLQAAFQKINSTLTSISASLFRLFRGKKWNPLRKRVDSCDASVDQWLLGTLAFSVLLFLMPTVVSFHLFFAIMRSILWAAQLPLQFALFFLTETPIYPLLCRIFWPQQLCCNLLLRKVSATAAPGAAVASSGATASVFALEAGCEGWDQVLREAMGKARLLVVAQLVNIKVRVRSLWNEAR
jgi:phosphatidylinositol glycan class Q protein